MEFGTMIAPLVVSSGEELVRSSPVDCRCFKLSRRHPLTCRSAMRSLAPLGPVGKNAHEVKEDLDGKGDPPRLGASR